MRQPSKSLLECVCLPNDLQFRDIWKKHFIQASLSISHSIPSVTARCRGVLTRSSSKCCSDSLGLVSALSCKNLSLASWDWRMILSRISSVSCSPPVVMQMIESWEIPVRRDRAGMSSWRLRSGDKERERKGGWRDRNQPWILICNELKSVLKSEK